jgi:SpoVK/Ycf46/Vps4 family AAA+-type ATPase
MSSNSDYDQWIAQGYRDDAEAAEDDAEEYVQAGEEAAAADKFEEAASHLKEYEEYTGKSRSSEIERLEHRANQLRNSSPKGDNASESGDSGAVEFGEESEALRSRVESFITTTDVGWEDIGGLEETKEQICHNIGLGATSGLPGAVQPSDRLLLFGVPGTGKTLLASAVANGTDTTFFNVKLGGLLSKWHGESSQLVSTLFAVARERTPAVVFIDEIDALTQARGGSSDSSSRRVLNSLLAELDGISKNSEEFLMVIGSSNRPMDLDDAVVRRFDSRIHVPLPDIDSASKIVRIHTVEGGVEFTGEPSEYAPHSQDVARSIPRTIGQACVRRGFSGSDIESLCRTAVSTMVHEQNPDLGEYARNGLDGLKNVDVSLRPLQPADVQEAFETVSASVPESSVREIEQWAAEYGSG